MEKELEYVMNISCPSCSKLVNIVNVEVFGNVTITTCSFGHRCMQINIEEKIQIKDSLGIKDQKGRLLDLPIDLLSKR
ncbi:MAG: hypothetical protein QW134_05840 [Nitrososphaeria archaeon]